MRFARGFTPIDLVVGVACVSVIAAVTAPRLQSLRAQSLIAEVGVNTEALFAAAEGLVAATGSEASLPLNPYPAPGMGASGETPRDWMDGVDDVARAAWGRLGWAPDGAVYCSYSVWTYEVYGPIVYSVCDLDGDENPYVRYRVGAFFERSGLLTVYEPWPGRY